MTVHARVRTALVTGGASGIGAAVVAALEADGFRTVSLDLAPSAVASASVIGDVREPAANREAVAAAVEPSGILDVAVANAGVHDGGLGLDAAPDELAARMRYVLDVDLVAYALVAQAAERPLRAARGQLVLTLSDAAFLVGQQGAGVAYTVAKHGALGLLGWLARELAPDVRVNAVAPGGVLTGLRGVGDDPQRAERIRSRNPLGTLLAPDEVAAYYRWLTSGPTVGLTGQVIRPDGGLAVR